MRGDAQVRFGRRTGETGRCKQQYGALVRSHDKAVVLCMDEKSRAPRGADVAVRDERARRRSSQ
jgi:hypothetical protein